MKAAHNGKQRRTGSSPHPRTRPDAPQECLRDCLISQAIDGLVVGFILTNPAGKVIWMNRAARQFLGVTEEEILGKSMPAVLHDPQLAAFWLDHQGTQANTLSEVNIRWPQCMCLKVNATPCCDENGKLIGRGLLFCDITHDRAIQVQLSQDVAQRFLNLTQADPGEPGPVSSLTPQEMQVLRLVGKGLGNQEIAQAMFISLSTVRSHLKHIYRKLELASRAEAVRFTVAHGLV